MRLVRALPGTFSNIKEHIRQEVADMISDIKLLKDIPDFSDTLKTHFKSNGHLQLFTTTIVPPPNKKNLSANKTGIEDESKKEDPKKQKEYKDNFEKWKVAPKIESDFKKGMIDTLSKLCNDSNSTTEIGSLQEFKDYCNKNKSTACFNCISINCFLRQKASKIAKLKKIFGNKCSKKQLTLGEVKAMAQKNVTPKKDEGVANNATATVTSSTNKHDTEIDGLIEAMYVNEDPTDNEFDLSFQNNMAAVKIGHNITAEKLQTRFHYWSSEDPEAMKPDKKCIVCHKRNMDWPRYSIHLENEHLIWIDEDDANYMKVSTVLESIELWNERDTSSINPRLYDSVNECELSEFESTSEDDDEEPAKVIPLQNIRNRKTQSQTESSSDSEDCQSDSSSRSKPSKKRQQVGKKLKEVSNHIDAVKEKVEGFEEKLINIGNITIEKVSKAFEEKDLQMQNEMNC